MRKDDLARALFQPASVALIGASADPAKPGGRPLHYLRRHGYGGRIYPINPRVSEIDGVRCYASLGEIPEPVDHAFIMLSGDAVTASLEACAEAGVLCATVLAGGFAETGASGGARQQRLAEIARHGGVRLLGPNSIGMINPAAGATLSANAMLELPSLTAGGTAVISQSGSMIGALLSHGEARKVGFSKLISVGNEADLGVGEIGDLLLDDPQTQVILLFLETVRDYRTLAAFARRAEDVGKPVIAYKLGRSEVGRELARSHTGALAGTEAAINAFLRHCGIARVHSIDGLIEAPRLFSGRRAGTGKRVAVASTTGGGGAMVVDNLGLSGIEVIEVPAAVRDYLRQQGIHCDGAHMVDLTMAGAKAEIIQNTIAGLMASEAADAVIMVVGSSAQFHGERTVAPLLEWRGAAKPFAVFLAPDAIAAQAQLAAAGIAVFRTPEACADAMQAVLHWRLPLPIIEVRDNPAASVPPLAAGDRLSEQAALALFAELGIAVTVSKLAKSADQAAAIATELDGQVVLKIASRDIPHKSDIGGVRLGLTDGDEIKAAFAEIVAKAKTAAPDARIEGALVQPMHTGLAEVLLGYRVDPLVGPTVMVALGGVLAEIHADSALRLAPVSLAGAREMIAEVRGLAPLAGFRGAKRGDREALAKALSDLSQLAGRPDIHEAEVNPVLVRPATEGIIAVDGLVFGAAL